MRTGKLAISRGHEVKARQAAVVTPVSFSPAPAAGELDLVHARLNALERLTGLVERGALSVEEFKLEKALVLRLTGEELLLTEIVPVAPAAPPGRSLLGRLVSGPGLAVVALGGLAAFAVAQPDLFAWLFEQGLRLAGI